MRGVPKKIAALIDSAPVVESGAPLEHPTGSLWAATQIAQHGSTHVAVRALAGHVCRGVPSADGAPLAVAKWVRRNVKYRRETPGIEVLSGPISTLRVGHGDCDDLVILWAALCMALGLNCRPCSAGVQRGDRVHWCHMVGWSSASGQLYELSVETWYGQPKSGPLLDGRGAEFMIAGPDGRPLRLQRVNRG